MDVDGERPPQFTQSPSLAGARSKSRSRGTILLCGVESGRLWCLAISNHDISADFLSDRQSFRNY